MQRRNKFHAIKTVVDGITFDSKREAKRYQDLKLLQRAGEIQDLVVDKASLRYKLEVNGVLIGKYTGDFGYTEKGVRILEDVKGVRTRDYILRKKLMKALYGIDIKEIN